MQKRSDRQEPGMFGRLRLDLEHGAMPDMTARALHHLADRISKLETMMVLPIPALAEEATWFYAI